MSDDDRVLRELREAARAESEGPLADPRWDALARGDLDEEGRAALADLAAKDHGLEGAMEAFGPLPEGSEDRFLSAIRAQLPASPAVAKVVSLEDRRASETPVRRSRTGWILTASTALAAAAAITLWVTLGRDPASTALPEYTLSATGGQRDVRGDPPETVVLAPGARLTLDLRPARSADVHVEARAFLVQGDIEVPVEVSLVFVSEDGAVRLSGRALAAPDLRPGAVDAVVVLARPGVFRADPETLASLRGRGAPVREARRSLVWRTQ